MITERASAASQDGLALDDLVAQQGSAANYNIAESGVVRRRLYVPVVATAWRIATEEGMRLATASWVNQEVSSPNPRLQRGLVRLPLSRKPLGGG